MVVIDRQEFVIVLLADFVADDLPVDDGGHPVLALSLCRMDGYLAYFHFAPMTSFLIPAPVLVEIVEIPAVNHGSFGHLFLGKSLLRLFFKKRLFLLLVPCQVFLHFRMQADTDAPVAVQGFHRHLVPVVRCDDVIEKLDAFLYRMFFNGVGGQHRRLFRCQVIDEIGGNRLRLHGQRPLLRIHDKAVRGQALLPFLVGEVHGRADQFLVGLGRLAAPFPGDKRRDNALQVL